MVHGGHATEDELHVGVVSNPPKGIRGNTCFGIKVSKTPTQVIAKGHQRPAFDRLHYDDRNPKLCGKVVARRPCLLLSVQEIVLDLTEIPGAMAQNVGKLLIDLVEREAQVYNLASTLLLLQEGEDA